MSDGQNEDQLGPIAGRGCAALRFADSLLRSLGHSQVTIRIPNPSTGDTASQLGLEAPAAADLQVTLALVKDLPPATDGRRRIEAVISATALKAIAQTYQVEDIVGWLQAAEGVVHGDQLMRIDTVSVDRFLGAPCLYHLTATE